jgi:hypothetical protein
MIHERRGFRRKSDDSADRSIGKGFPGMLQEALQLLANVFPYARELL